MREGTTAAQHRLSTEEIDRARSRFDLIASDVALKRKGRELVGLCPFHNEKSPSVYVVPSKGFFHCFGCGVHGTAIDCVARARGLRFVDAMHEINGTRRSGRDRQLPPPEPARPASAIPPKTSRRSFGIAIRWDTGPQPTSTCRPAIFA